VRVRLLGMQPKVNSVVALHQHLAAQLQQRTAGEAEAKRQVEPMSACGGWVD
jgi:hypothetical protein